MSGGGKRSGGGVAMGSTPAPASSSSSAMIPAGSRKMVLSLKEIVDCSEAEIYAMLKECNMDPSETIHRLLNQDTFHEVKSKRDKKKETKEPDFRSRAVNNNSNRGARGGTGRTGSIQSSSYDYGAAQSKPVHKKDNGTNVVPTSTATAGSGTLGNSFGRRSATLSEVVTMQSTPVVPTIADMPPLSSQPSPVLQQSWARAPGQLSMADIVRMGRPQSKQPSITPAHDSFMPNMPHLSGKQPPPTTMSPLNLVPESSQVLVSHDEETGHELNTGDDWSTHPEISTTPSLPADEVNLEQNPHLDDNQVEEGDGNADTLQTESTRSESISDGQTDLDNSEEGAHVDDGPLDAMGSYHTQHALECHEVGDVDEQISSSAANLQQLNLHKGELDASPSEDNPAVIIPSHLQVTNADCSHLSFGSFGSAVNASLPGSFQSNPLRNNLETTPVAEDSLRNNLEMTPVAEDSTSLDQLNSRNTEYYDDDQLQSTLNDNVTSITNTSTRSYDMPAASHSESNRDDNLDAEHGLQGNFPSASGYAFPVSSQQSAATYTYPVSQMQNLSPFSNLMHPYTNSLPSSLLAPTVQPPREFDIPLSALLANQALKYNTQAPSMSGPISTPEVKQEVFSAPQPSPQTLPTSSMPTPAGPTLPQHLPTYPYSQPTLPLGHFANMISYPFLPQSYTFLPSAAYQQAYTANSPFHQSPNAGIKYSALPQYKSSISASSNLPQSPSLPPGYGGFTSSTNNIPGYGGFTGSTNNIPTGFSLNPTNTTASTGMGFEEALSSQYKEGSQYLPLQHNENSAMWLHGAGSRAAVSALPGNTFYGVQAHQNQHNGSGFRQAPQQPSQYGPGPMGYLNFYQSQGGPSQEQIQQNPSEGNVSGSQGPASHQMWQQHGHGY